MIPALLVAVVIGAVTGLVAAEARIRLVSRALHRRDRSRREEP